MVVIAAMVMLVVVKMMVVVVVMVILVMVMVVIMVKTCPHWLPYTHKPFFNIYPTGMLWLLHGCP